MGFPKRLSGGVRRVCGVCVCVKRCNILRKVYKMILNLSVLSHLIIFVIARHQLR